METVQKRTLPADLSAPPILDGYRSRAIFVGGFLGLLSLVGAVVDFNHFIRAYLVAFVFWWGLSIGCQALLMVQYLSGGKWGLVIRRILEASSRNLPMMAVLGLPIIFSIGRIYPWAHPATLEEGARRAVEFRQHLPGFLSFLPYQNSAGFIGRYIVFFGIWIGYMYFLNKWSLERDQEMGHEAYWRVKFENISGLGVVVYVLTMTFAVVDWVLSIDPTWFSTMYGLIYLAGQGLASLSLVIISLAVLSRVEPMKTVLRKTELHDIGKLTLAFVMLFAYFGFSQFLIVWSGNLSDEIPWYLDRITGGWGWVISLIVIGHFVLPFLLLLSRNLKRNKAKIVPLAAFIMFMRMVDVFWYTAPSFADSKRHFPVEWWMLLYLVVPLAIGGFWVAAFITQLKRRPLIQVNDVHLEEVLELEHAAF